MIAKIDNIFSKVTWILSIVSYVGFIALMLLICADVFMRKIFSNGINGTYEMVQFGLMAAVFMSFAYTESNHGHIKVSLLVGRMKNVPKFLCVGITGLMGAACAGFVAYCAVLQVIYSFQANTVTDVLHIPRFPFYALEALGMAVYAIALLWEAIRNFVALGNKELALKIQENWN